MEILHRREATCRQRCMPLSSSRPHASKRELLIMVLLLIMLQPLSHPTTVILVADAQAPSPPTPSPPAGFIHYVNVDCSDSTPTPIIHMVSSTEYTLFNCTKRIQFLFYEADGPEIHGVLVRAQGGHALPHLRVGPNVNTSQYIHLVVSDVTDAVIVDDIETPLYGIFANHIFGALINLTNVSIHMTDGRVMCIMSQDDVQNVELHLVNVSISGFVSVYQIFYITADRYGRDVTVTMLHTNITVVVNTLSTPLVAMLMNVNADIEAPVSSQFVIDIQFCTLSCTINCTASNTSCGADGTHGSTSLLEARQLQGNLIGVSFHVADSFLEGIVLPPPDPTARVQNFIVLIRIDADNNPLNVASVYDVDVLLVRCNCRVQGSATAATVTVSQLNSAYGVRIRIYDTVIWQRLSASVTAVVNSRVCPTIFINSNAISSALIEANNVQVSHFVLSGEVDTFPTTALSNLLYNTGELVLLMASADSVVVNLTNCSVIGDIRNGTMQLFEGTPIVAGGISSSLVRTDRFYVSSNLSVCITACSVKARMGFRVAQPPAVFLVAYNVIVTAMIAAMIGLSNCTGCSVNITNTTVVTLSLDFPKTSFQESQIADWLRSKTVSLMTICPVNVTVVYQGSDLSSLINSRVPLALVPAGVRGYLTSLGNPILVTNFSITIAGCRVQRQRLGINPVDAALISDVIGIFGPAQIVRGGNAVLVGNDVAISDYPTHVLACSIGCTMDNYHLSISQSVNMATVLLSGVSNSAWTRSSLEIRNSTFFVEGKVGYPLPSVLWATTTTSRVVIRDTKMSVQHSVFDSFSSFSGDNVTWDSSSSSASPIPSSSRLDFGCLVWSGRPFTVSHVFAAGMTRPSHATARWVSLAEESYNSSIRCPGWTPFTATVTLPMAPPTPVVRPPTTLPMPLVNTAVGTSSGVALGISVLLFSWISPSPPGGSGAFPCVQGTLGAISLHRRCLNIQIGFSAASATGGGGNQDDPPTSMDPVDNPTQAHLGASFGTRLEFSGGAVVANTGLCVGVAFLVHGLARIRQRWLTSAATAAANTGEHSLFEAPTHRTSSMLIAVAASSCRWLPTSLAPGSGVLIYGALLQPTVTASTILVADSSRSTISVVLGLVGLMMWVGVTVYASYRIAWRFPLKNVPENTNAKTTLRNDDGEDLRSMRSRVVFLLEYLLHPDGRWIYSPSSSSSLKNSHRRGGGQCVGKKRQPPSSSSCDHHEDINAESRMDEVEEEERAATLLDRYRPVFELYTKSRHAYFIVEFSLGVLSGVVIGAALSVSSAAACEASVWGASIVMGISCVQLIAYLATQPFASRVDFILAVGVSALGIISQILSMTNDDTAAGDIVVVMALVILSPMLLEAYLRVMRAAQSHSGYPSGGGPHSLFEAQPQRRLAADTQQSFDNHEHLPAASQKKTQRPTSDVSETDIVQATLRQLVEGICSQQRDRTVAMVQMERSHHHHHQTKKTAPASDAANKRRVR